MKFQIGDCVVIRTDLISDKKYFNDGFSEEHRLNDDDGYCEYAYFVDEMSDCKGKEATIVSIEDHYYKIDLDDESWVWTDGMFEDCVSELMAIDEQEFSSALASLL